MKARLKDQESVTMLSEMQELQFAVVLENSDHDHILFRPLKPTGVFAVNLTNGEILSEAPKIYDCKVRILQEGEVIEITN